METIFTIPGLSLIRSKMASLLPAIVEERGKIGGPIVGSFYQSLSLCGHLPLHSTQGAYEGFPFSCLWPARFSLTFSGGEVCMFTSSPSSVSIHVLVVLGVISTSPSPPPLNHYQRTEIKILEVLEVINNKRTEIGPLGKRGSDWSKRPS